MTPTRFDEATSAAGRQRTLSASAVTVMKAGARLARAIERSLTDTPLTLPQFNVLMELAGSEGGVLPMHEMTDRLISTPPSMSGLTTRMRDLGLITKQRSGEDERVVLLEVTEAGWDALEQAMPRVFEAEKELFADYKRADLQEIIHLLEPLID